ncbi:PLC-like phosphodiesterases superfamily protein [Artemisia annua]|uniref:PLC-like phosphodiesterases superfamily protein n=1 Tax=Artemisia annua TaxID=35608 RepID=A0A2U1KWB8_ARTAN|nr:PLC-like phosphodiesterases superfamily protein [Artemisia annua]
MHQLHVKILTRSYILSITNQKLLTSYMMANSEAIHMKSYLGKWKTHILFITSFACSNGDCQLLESCSAPTDCGGGLYCGNCPQLGKNQPFCIRGQANIPTATINGLPFNKYTWLVTHNAFSMVDAPLLTGPQRITFYNQEDTVTNQLRQPAINTLREVEAFLSSNPTEIVTIILEDYVHTTKALTKLFADAGLDKYWYPVSKMPKKGEDWPTVTNMAQDNHRLLVFTSDSSKEVSEGIAYQWRYMVENEPGDPGVQKGSCQNRKESKALTSKSASLFLQNYFPTMPVQAEACKEHSTPLMDMIATCYKSAGNVMPNFLAVNFYMRSDGGGVFDALDKMNGQSLCGCASITACEAGAPFGVCKNIGVANSTSPAGPSGSFSGTVQLTGSASQINFTTGDPGVQKGSCQNRKESKALTSKSASLFLQNYFPTMPVQAEACKEHSTPLMDMIATCYKSAGNVMPNFLAVNFYMRSDGGGVFDALDKMNGQSLCGCASITACEAGAPFGVCKNIGVANSTSPAGPSGSFSGTVQLTGSASQINFTSLFFIYGFHFCIILLGRYAHARFTVYTVKQQSIDQHMSRVMFGEQVMKIEM